MAAIPLTAEPCPGRRNKVWNRRWPICSTCDIQDDNGTAEPAAVMQGDQPVCPNRRFHVPTARGISSAQVSHGLGPSCNHSEHTPAVMCGNEQERAA